MSNPAYTKRAKRRWKTLKKMLDAFRKLNGREMTVTEFRKALS